MKSNLLKFFALSCLAFTQLAPIAAQAGPGGGNGGDPSEIEFKEIASNIGAWIRSGNADDITLPPSVTLSTYKSRMLAALSNYHISFTDKVVTVSGAEKTCRNEMTANGGTILCNIKRFGEETGERKYRITHHEFAGLAGLEVNTGDDSKYVISEQVSQRLQAETVMRLPVTPPVIRNPELVPIAAAFFGAEKHLPGPCENLDLKGMTLQRYNVFVEGLKVVLAKSGREIESVESSLSPGFSDSIRGERSGEAFIFRNLALKPTLSFKLKNGIVLDVVFASSRIFSLSPKDDTAKVVNYAGFAQEYGTESAKKFGPNGELLSTQVSCHVWPQLNSINLVNHDTKKPVMFASGDGVSFGPFYP